MGAGCEPSDSCAGRRVLSDDRAPAETTGLAEPIIVAAPLSPREFRIVIIALTTTMLLTSLDYSVVGMALPRMASELGGLDHISWVITAFMLCATISTPLYGKLSDVYGRRNVLIGSICLSFVASVLCGLSQNMVQLILARGLQGVGSGGLLILVQTIIADLVPPRERGRYVGVITGAMTIGNVSGPLIGGWLTEALSWRLVFVVGLPVGIAALILIATTLRDAGPRRPHRIDYVGAFLLAICATCALVVLSWAGPTEGWQSHPTLALTCVAFISGVLLYWWERRVAEPMIDMALFRTPNLLTASLASGLTNFAMQGMLVFVPLYLQFVTGLGPLEAGLVTLPQIGAMLVSSLLFGPISSRYGRPKWTLVGGTLVQAVAIAALLASASRSTDPVWFVGCLALFGLGQGVGMPSATLIVQAVARPGQLGVATSAIAFIRSLGGSIGLAVSGGVMAVMLSARLAPLPIDAGAVRSAGLEAMTRVPPHLRGEIIDAFRHAILASFAVSLVVMLFALVVAWRVADDELARD